MQEKRLERPNPRLTWFAAAALAVLAAACLAGCQASASEGKKSAEAAAKATGTLEVGGAVERQLTLTTGRAEPAITQPDKVQLRLQFSADDPHFPRALIYVADLPGNLDEGTLDFGESDVDLDIHFSPGDPSGSTERFQADSGRLVVDRLDNGKISGNFTAKAEEYSFKSRDERRWITLEVKFAEVPLKRPGT